MLYNAGLTLKLRQILDQDKLRFVFQPIVDIAQSTVLGYEVLMRGPAGTLLERPDELLRMAKACNLGLGREAAACKGALRAFAALHLPGMLSMVTHHRLRACRRSYMNRRAPDAFPPHDARDEPTRPGLPTPRRPTRTDAPL